MCQCEDGRAPKICLGTWAPKTPADGGEIVPAASAQNPARAFDLGHLGRKFGIAPYARATTCDPRGRFSARTGIARHLTMNVAERLAINRKPPAAPCRTVPGCASSHRPRTPCQRGDILPVRPARRSHPRRGRLPDRHRHREAAGRAQLLASISLAKFRRSSGRPNRAYAAGFSPTREMPEIAEAQALASRLA